MERAPRASGSRASKVWKAIAGALTEVSAAPVRKLNIISSGSVVSINGKCLRRRPYIPGTQSTFVSR